MCFWGCGFGKGKNKSRREGRSPGLTDEVPDYLRNRGRKPHAGQKILGIEQSARLDIRTSGLEDRIPRVQKLGHNLGERNPEMDVRSRYFFHPP